MANDDPSPEADAPPERPERPARRRPRRWQVATAAATAVAVIAGGWYGAQSWLADGGSDASDETPSDAPLLLDGGPAASDAGAELSRGLVAPEELRATGPLPEGPDRAAAYHFDGDGDAEVPKEAAAELGRALGLDGPVREEGGAWVLGGGDGAEPGLTVQRQAPGQWTYGTDSGTSGADDEATSSDAASTDAPPDEAAPPPAPEEARAVADPVLAALGLADGEAGDGDGGDGGDDGDGAAVADGQTVGSERVVRASPEVDGLPTQGLETLLYVGADGELARAQGALADAAPEERTHPVSSAEDTLERHNERARVPGEPVPEPAPLEVTGAEFGLALHHSDGEPLLVPSWLFQTATPDADALPFATPAVPHTYPESPEPDVPDAPGTPEPAPPTQTVEPDHRSGEQPGDGGGSDAEPGDPAEVQDSPPYVESHDPADESVTLRMWGGACTEYAGTAEETEDAVTLVVAGTAEVPGEACVMLAQEHVVEIELAEPVGDRVLLDERGEELPVR